MKKKYTSLEAKIKANELFNNKEYKNAKKILLALLKKGLNEDNLFIMLAIIAKNEKNYHLEIEYYKKSLAISKNEKSFINISTRLIEERRLNEAENYLNDAIKIYPNSFGVNHNFGRLNFYSNNLNEAVKYLTKAIKIEPNGIPALLYLGEIYYLQGNYSKAEEHYQNCLKNVPNDYDLHLNYGRVLLENNKYSDAENIFKKAIEINKLSYKAYINLGVSLDKQNKTEQAIINYNKANKIHKTTESYHNIGIGYDHIGEIDKAIEAYKEAIKIKKESYESFRNLVNTGKSSDYSKYINFYETEFKKSSKKQDKISLGFALYKVYERKKNYKKAAYYLKKANDNENTMHSFSLEGYKKNCEDIIHFYKKIKPIKLKQNTIIPIFIVGMPRSGSTLLEQILYTNNQVTAAGELPFLPEIVRKYSEEIDYNRNKNDFLKAIRKNYLKKINTLNNKNTKYITDKLPQNFMNIGLINTSLPEAKIINIKRNKNDNILSIYQQRFTDGLNYSFNEKNIKDYYLEYEKMMDNWNALYLEKIFNINYEEIVNNFDVIINKLFNWLSLEFTNNEINFHKNITNIKTTSKTQVRKPLHTKSKEKWKNYKEYLPELFE
tara:strand:+ start:200 stop:2020 length:1821 start_codon:yes stop_codon:yes gene_type:complete